jgi:hypothetical protein
LYSPLGLPSQEMYSRMAKSLRKYMWKTVGQKDPLKKDTHFVPGQWIKRIKNYVLKVWMKEGSQRQYSTHLTLYITVKIYKK